MKISIIVPVYNVEQYIKECFDSIAAQTYKGDIECIFVDDCGQDYSVSVLKKLIAEYKGPIQFSIVHHEHNKGLSGARNTGIRNASGDYLYFLDSDDSITSDCIEKLTALAEKYPGVDIVQGSTKSKLNWFQLANKHFPEFSDNFKWIRRTMLLRYSIPMTAWNKLARKDMVVKNGLYFEEGLIHEDEVWNFMLAKYVHSIAFCCDITYIYRENMDGIMGQSKEFNYAPVLNIMVDRASNPYMCSEITCILSLAGNKYKDIVRQLYRFKGIDIYIKLKNKVYCTKKYTPWGFLYRVLFKGVKMYIEKVN